MGTPSLSLSPFLCKTPLSSTTTLNLPLQNNQKPCAFSPCFARPSHASALQGQTANGRVRYVRFTGSPTGSLQEKSTTPPKPRKIWNYSTLPLTLTLASAASGL